MPLRVTCPDCGASRDANEDQRGKKVPCRKCEALIRVPAKAKKPDPDDDDAVEIVEEVTPVKKKAVPAPPLAKSRKRRDDDYEEEAEDEKPRGKKGKKQKERSKGATVAIAAVLIVVIVAGLSAGGYFMFKGDGTPNTPVPSGPPGGGPVGMQMPGPSIPNGGGGAPNAGGGGGTTTPPVSDPGKPKDPPKATPDPVIPVTSTPQISRKTIYNYVLKSTAWIITKHLEGGAMGTGSLIDRDNRLVLTNYHVVHGMIDFVVFFPVYDKEGKLIEERNVYLAQAKREDAVKGKVVAHDKIRDLALIQLDKVPEGVEPLPFSKADPSKGDEVHSVGNPGASGSLWVYTHGAVRSVYKKQWKAGGADFVLDLNARIVETDSPTNHGDSGGPCVNDRGELVGVTQGGSRDANAIAIFISHSEATDFVSEAFKAAPLLVGKTWARSQRPTLVASGGGEAAKLPALVAKLGSSDDTVRAEGAQGLALLGPDARLALPELVKALADKNALVRRLVAHALRQIGQPTPKDLPDLLPALDSASPEARIYVLEALAVLGGVPEAAPGAPAVLKAADDPDAKVRFQAMRAVGRMVEVIGDKDATTVLEKGVQDPDKKVQAAAAESLAADVPTVKNSVPRLTALLKQKEPEVRIQAAKAIGRLGEKAKPATPDLLDAVRSDNRELRRASFVALKAVGATPQELIPVLRNGIKDEDVEVRRAALLAAADAGPAGKDLVPAIVDALSDSDVRIAALAALKKFGPDAREAAPGVVNLLATDKTLRSDALSTLVAMKISGSTVTLVVPKLIAIFEDERQKPVRDKVAEALASIGKPAIPELVTALRNPNAEIRRGAASSLGAMGPTAREVAPTLQLVFTNETNPQAKDEEIAALRRIQSAPPLKQ
jgi:HEAT repeat protein